MKEKAKVLVLILLKQSQGSPSKGRFNPHGDQPEPKKIEIKSQAKKSHSLKKKVFLKEDEDFSKFQIEQMLADEVSKMTNQQIEFRNEERAPGGWLPLEACDDADLDSKTPAGWLRLKGDGKFVPAKGL